jgi:hypothetical protein
MKYIKKTRRKIKRLRKTNKKAKKQYGGVPRQSKKPENPSEAMPKVFVDGMYANMWQFMNPQTIQSVLASAGCHVKLTHKYRVDDDIFGPEFYNSICQKGPPEKGHYVYISPTGEVTGTYENNLLFPNDDGICHGAAMAAALNTCGINVGPIYKNPDDNIKRLLNYVTIMKTYTMIIYYGWWDNALKTYFYYDVKWMSDNLTQQTINSTKLLQDEMEFLTNIGRRIGAI